MTAKERSLSFLQKQCFCEFPSYRKWHIRFSFIAFLSFSAGEDQWVQFHQVFGTLFFSLLFFSLRAYTDSKEGKRSWDGRVVGKWIMDWILTQESGLIYAVMGC